MGVGPVGLGPHLGEEHRELAVVGRRARVTGSDAVVVDVPHRGCRVGVAAHPGDRRPGRVAGPVLLRTDEDHAGHAHVDVLDVLHVAVEHVRPCLTRAVGVRELASRRHRHRPARLPVEERDDVAEPVPVQGVRVEEVGAQRQAEVGQLDPELVRLRVVVLVDPEDRGGVLSVVLLLEALGGRHAGDVPEPEDVGGQARRDVRTDRVRVERRDGRRPRGGGSSRRCRRGRGSDPRGPRQRPVRGTGPSRPRWRLPPPPPHCPSARVPVVGSR